MSCCLNTLFSLRHEPDEVAEWLRRWTANPLCSARVGSNPILVVWGCSSVVERTLRMCEAPGSIPGISTIFAFICNNVATFSLMLFIAKLIQLSHDFEFDLMV